VEGEWRYGNIYGKNVGDGRKEQGKAGKKRVEEYWRKKARERDERDRRGEREGSCGRE